MKIISIIPARGGSKSLPRKNLVEFLGEPLINKTIEQSINSEYIDKTIVSTDNQEIKEHRIQPSMSACLKGKRVAERESKSHIQYQCIKSLAETEIYLGEKSIVKLILK